MAERLIDYYDSMSSPWTYLGHLRFMDLARRFGLTIRHQELRRDTGEGREGIHRVGAREPGQGLGQVIPPPEQLTPEALAAYHKAEIDKWWPMVRAAGIKIE